MSSSSSSSASSNALAKLEPFLLLAKSARGAAAAKLIVEVTAASGCYIFSELFDFDGIKELASSEQYQQEYRMLELFAYGDLFQYKSSPSGTFPKLTQNHINKLRRLTLVSLAFRSRVLSYSTLFRDLDLQQDDTTSIAAATATATADDQAGSSTGIVSSSLSARDIRMLEDIIIDAIYSGVISARLDQRKQRVEVESVMGRDVTSAQDIEKMSSILQEWSSTTTQLLTSLSSRIEQARKSDEDSFRQKTIQNNHLKNVLMQIANASPAGSGGGGVLGFGGKATYDRLGSDRMMGDMELDDDSNGIKKKKAPAGGPMRSKRSRA